MSAEPKITIYGKDLTMAIEIKPTREHASCGNSSQQSQGKVGCRQLEKSGSLKLISDMIDLTMEGDSGEKNWLEEPEIEYKREGNPDDTDPLQVDLTGSNNLRADNWKPENFVTEFLTVTADKKICCLESVSDDEEWMDEVEIEYTREETGVAVDPLADSPCNVYAEDKNTEHTPLDYSGDGSKGEIDYITVNSSNFDVNDELEPPHSTALFVDVYAPKSKEANGTFMANHRRIAKQLKTYACRLCNYRTYNRSDNHRHCRTHHGEESFASALKHIEPPNKRKPSTCSICDQTFSKKGELMLHMKTHKRGQPNVRNRRIRRIKSSWKHKRASTPERAKCTKNYKAGNGETRKVVDEDGVKDPLCFKEHLAYDQKDRKAGTRMPHECKSCEYRSTRKHDLKVHELKHTGVKLNQCTKCSYTCKRAGYLKIHMAIHHDPQAESQRKNAHGRFHNCTICHYRTRQMANLRVHMRSHTGEKPFACSVCHERFTQKGSLLIHMRHHTGERPYLCKMCGKGFTQISGRNSHSRICPKPPRIKECDICNYRCTRIRELLDHTKIHRSIRVVRLQED